jgi:DnaK suppressor protein
MATKKKRLTKDELTYFNGLLLAERDNIISDLKYLNDENLKQTISDSTGESSSYSNHLGDAAALAYEREFAMTLSERHGKYLEQIDDALLRVEEGTYGICQVTGYAIPKERLEAVLVAKYSVEGKELLKKRAGRVAH